MTAVTDNPTYQEREPFQINRFSGQPMVEGDQQSAAPARKGKPCRRLPGTPLAATPPARRLTTPDRVA